MDGYLWVSGLLLILFLVFAVAETASQLLSKHKVQLILDTIRQKSVLNRLLLPDGAGALRSKLTVGRLIAVSAFVLSLTPVLGMPLEYAALWLAGAAVIILYAPVWIAYRNPRALLTSLLPLLRFFNIVLLPIALPRDFLFRRYRTGRAQSDVEEFDDEAQVEAYIGEAEQEGIFEPAEAEIVRQVMEFSDTFVREVMTPRVNMDCIDVSTSLRDFATISADLKFSRYPVIDGRIDNVVGIVHIKSLLGVDEQLLEKGTVRDLMTPPYFVPESKKVFSLLRDFQGNKQQMAIVVDEYGGTAGIVTLEDVIEEIVGEIADEHDEEDEQEIVMNEDGSWTVSGNVNVADLEKIMNAELGDEITYETISGLALSILKHIPKNGESFEVDGGIHIEILDASERSINKLRIVKPTTNE